MNDFQHLASITLPEGNAKPVGDAKWQLLFELDLTNKVIRRHVGHGGDPNPFGLRNLAHGFAFAAPFCALFAGLWIITP